MDFSDHIELAKAKCKEIEVASDEFKAATDLVRAATAKLGALYSDMSAIETNAGADGHLISELREHRDADNSEADSEKQPAAAAVARKSKRASKKA
jgi:hypothetical protein